MLICITDLPIVADIIIEDHIQAPGLVNSPDSKDSSGQHNVEDIFGVRDLIVNWVNLRKKSVFRIYIYVHKKFASWQ